MILSQITSLISEKNYTKALSLIQDELSKSYDFNDPVQKNLFDTFHNLFDSAQEGLMDYLYSSESQSATRSFSPMDKFIPQKQLQKEIIQNDLQRISIAKSSFDYIEQNGDNVVIVLNIIKDERIKKIFGFDDDWMTNSEKGSYLITEGSHDLQFYVLNAMVNPNGEDNFAILKGFVELINTLLPNDSVEIKIFFINEGTTIQSNTYKLLFLYFLAHLIYALSVKTFLTLQIYFKEEIVKQTFEHTALRISTPIDEKNFIKSYSKEKVNRLAEKALTQDQKYISQLDSLARIINEDIPVLILGESGVGKTWLAKIIHNESIRNQCRFEEQNCGGILAERLEPNLFGWVKGGFTSAINDKKGKVTLAEGGTLFLDEIHRADIAVRNALLTFIENKQYNVLGKELSITANVRLLFGTNKDLPSLIKKKEFEEDFYYRISGRKITIPPIRDRINDIEIIANYTVENLCREKGKIITLEAAAVDLLKSYSWPGNVRELTKYLELRFLDCLAEDTNKITAQMVVDAPFENLAVTDKEDLDTLIELLKKFLDNWDITQGDIQHKLLAPIIAKLYIEDSFKHWNKTKKYVTAMKVVGMDGKTFNSSTLHRFYEEYPSIHRILGLEE